MRLRKREFRIALSHSIDRDQINETFVLGLAVTGSAAPGERTLYSPGPEYRTLHSTLDVKKSNEMLDALGLDRKDAEGYRLRQDGQGRLRLEAITYLAFLALSDNPMIAHPETFYFK
jgi:peptide/nickel transport system substrate-binding protein